MHCKYITNILVFIEHRRPSTSKVATILQYLISELQSQQNIHTIRVHFAVANSLSVLINSIIILS